MSFQLETGHTYWILDQDGYALLTEVMGGFGGNNFLADFNEYNGMYYAKYEDINSDEFAFLDDWGLAEPYLYILSNQFPGDV